MKESWGTATRRPGIAENERNLAIIVQRRGKPAIALIEANELSSMMELVHLLRSPANAKRLIEASEEVSSGSHRET
jgi:antitoxin YefM